MAIFVKKQDKFIGLAEKLFDTEREMHNLIENNLEELFGLKFVAREFAPQGDFRIDTVAFDSDQKSFVIIEYKKGTNWSVIDQGFSYLSLLLDRKADFVLELNEKHNERFVPRDINWEASRVIFISQSFGKF